ncbi:MAG: hypothetical protein AMK69_27260 [Nitrospira bacterium SG8_3]|nr:MAG: hypothetical protein AMK69_27260 [Nitrospira bacterium SG8_3]
MEMRIRLGISACLLGEKVRYDGGHKHDRYLTDTLGRYVEYVPVCPELEAGFGIPREAMHLEGDPKAQDLCGFIFKSRSPSSGMERIPVYNEKGMPVKKGVGLFAHIFMDHFPLLPVEDEGRLHDPKLRENFIECVFVFKRWRECLSRGKSRRGLIDFHTKHKLLILSHSPKHYQMMGRLVGQAKAFALDELYQTYQRLLLEALRLKTTIKKNANVLQHMMGYFKKELSADEKQELLEIIGLYREVYVPLIVPITLMNHYIRKYDQPYLKEQYYLQPHPIELQLRNHA